MKFSKQRTGLTLIVAAMLAMTGCVSANVTEPSACDAETINFPLTGVPTLPAGVNACSATLPPGTPTTFNSPPYSTTKNFNFSSALNQNTSGVDITAQITQLVVGNINQELSWVPTLEVDIAGSTPATPKVELATYTNDNSGSPDLNVSVVLDGNTILNYLKSGPVTLTFTIGSAPITQKVLCELQGYGSSIPATVNMCVSAHASVSKSL